MVPSWIASALTTSTLTRIRMEWMTKRGIQGATDEESCTQHCVKDMGGSYVLVVKKDVYKLDDQVKAEQFAGKKVKISGTLDAETHTLHVFDMEEDK